MPGYSPSPSEERKNRIIEEREKALVAAFKQNPCRKTLMDFHTHLLKSYIETSDVISELRHHKALLSEERQQREFKGVEYEAKLNLKGNWDGSLSGEYLEKLLRRIKIDDGFLFLGEICSRDSKNFYYGNQEESLVVMRGDNMVNLKYKEDMKILTSPSFYGLVMKRREKVRRGCLEEDVIAAIDETLLRDNKYRGFIIRERSRGDILSLSTGRLFTLVLDLCRYKKKGEKSERLLKQIEIEYVGYLLNNFGDFRLNSEQQIVDDILDLTSILRKRTIRTCNMGFGIRDLQPTKERKYDLFLENEKQEA